MEDNKFEDVVHKDNRSMYIGIDDMAPVLDLCSHPKDEKSLHSEAEIPKDLEELCIQVESLVMDAYFAGRRSVEKEIQEEKDDLVPICKDCLHNDKENDMCDEYDIVIPDGCVSCEGYEKESELCKLCKMCTFTNETYEGYEIGSVTRCTKKKGNPPINEIHSDGCEDFVNRGAHSCTECVHYSEKTDYVLGYGNQLIQYCDTFDDTLGDTVPCYRFKEKETAADTDMVDICEDCVHCSAVEIPGPGEMCEDEMLYHCEHFRKKMRNISACSAFENVDMSCDDCAFLRTNDHVEYRCIYHDNIVINPDTHSQCDNKITWKMVDKSGLNIYELDTMVEAFNYFRKDGGCDRCGSQRCPGNAEMILDGAYCEAFKEWCKEEED